MRMIWITTQKEGMHRWRDAPEEVAFLRNLHRHIFNFKVWIEVSHDNRELEFILFKRFVDEALEEIFNNQPTDGYSCEHLGDILFGHIKDEYPNREVWIEVSEDKENGSFKKYKHMY